MTQEAFTELQIMELNRELEAEQAEDDLGIVLGKTTYKVSVDDITLGKISYNVPSDEL